MSRNLFAFIVLLIISCSVSSQVFNGSKWKNWGEEPDYEGQTGYHNHPFDLKTYSTFKAPEDWFISLDKNFFDFLWDLELIATERMENIIGEHNILNPSEFSDQWPSWKAIHDGKKLYVLMKLQGVNTFYDHNPKSFTVMVQPTSVTRHEPTFNEGVALNDLAKMNMAYGRYIELGGGNALFSDGEVLFYSATNGSNGMDDLNLHGFNGLIEETHFWHLQDDVLSAMLVMDFETVLSYPSNPDFPDENRIPISEKTTLAFDIFTHAYNYNEGEIIYSWSSDRYNVMVSNYYAGRLHIDSAYISNQKVHLTTNPNPSNGGTTLGDGDYFFGNLADASAIPNEGWRFVEWTVNDKHLSFDNPLSFEIFSNIELKANFTDKLAQLIIEPDSLNLVMETGDFKERDIILHNIGNNDLNFSITWDGFTSSKTGELKSITYRDEFGYFWIDSDQPTGPSFAWNSIKHEENKLINVSTCNDCQDIVDLNFEFPFYGISYNKISVSTYGFITTVYSHWPRPHNRPLPDYSAFQTLIAGYWADLSTYNNENSNIYFKDFGNYAIVEYDNVMLANETGTVTFQIVIYSTGEIEFYYSDVPESNQNFTVGIQNRSKEIGLQVAYNESYIKNNQVISIKALPFWISCQPDRGEIKPNEQQVIKLDIDARSLNHNIHNIFLSFRSNDPHNFSQKYQVTVDITGYPEIETSYQSIDFGILGLGQKLQDTLTIYNPGGATLEISNIDVSNPVFNISANQLTVLPFDSEILIIEFESDVEEIFVAELILQTNVEGKENFFIPISAETRKLNIEFIILDESGDPLEDIYISMANHDIYYFINGYTNQDGYKLFENVFTGKYYYSIYWDEYPRQDHSLSIIDQSVSIIHNLVKPDIWFELPESGLTYNVGQDDFVQITINVKGYSYLSYYLTAVGEGFDYECFVLTDLIDTDTINSIDVKYLLTPYTREGNYSFKLWSIDMNSNQNQIISETITIINNSTVIDAIWPDRQGYSVLSGFPKNISWMSYNVDSVNIYYNLGNNNEWSLIAENIKSDTGLCGGLQNNYFWHIPVDIVSEKTQIRLKFESVHDPSIYSISEMFHLISTTTSQSGTYDEVKIFPNPTNKKVNIYSPRIISEIKIIDNLGRIVISKTGITESEIEMDVSFLNPGIYFVILVNDGKVNALKLQVIN